MRVAVAQLGARMHYAVPRILEGAGLLERFFTDSYSGDKPLVRAALGAVPRRWRPRPLESWLARNEPALPPARVTSFERLGLAYVGAQRRARGTRNLRAVFAEFGRRFDEAILRHGLGAADTVYGFNGAALELFTEAKRRGLRCILEQTMAPHRFHDRILREELERWPDWQPDLDVPAEGECPLAPREEAEWALADQILCGSEFVVEALAECGGPVETCRVVPYGVDPQRFAVLERQPKPPGEPLRVLFVGEVGLRKGAPYLLEALRALGPEKVEARLAGRLALPPAKLDPYSRVASFLGPVPRTQIRDLYAWADVFVLPSLCEGSATVTYEAMAAGLPVVTTPNAGSIVRDGIDGHIVPPRDPEAIARWLDHYAERPGELAEMRRAARMRSEEFSLAAYAERLVGALSMPRGCQTDPRKTLATQGFPVD